MPFPAAVLVVTREDFCEGRECRNIPDDAINLPSSLPAAPGDHPDSDGLKVV